MDEHSLFPYFSLKGKVKESFLFSVRYEQRILLSDSILYSHEFAVVLKTTSRVYPFLEISYSMS